jgi:hypothetical protein
VPQPTTLPHVPSRTVAKKKNGGCDGGPSQEAKIHQTKFELGTFSTLSFSLSTLNYKSDHMGLPPRSSLSFLWTTVAHNFLSTSYLFRQKATASTGPHLHSAGAELESRPRHKLAIFRVFPQSLEANTRTIHRSGPYRFLQNPI